MTACQSGLAASDTLAAAIAALLGGMVPYGHDTQHGPEEQHPPPPTVPAEAAAELIA